MAAPLLVSVAFDNETDVLVETATALAAKMGAPLAAVHALGWRPLESEAQLSARMHTARERLNALLAGARAAGVEVLEPIVVGRQRASDLVVETASELGAQLIVAGGGGAHPVRRWLIGSVAERIVRVSSVPVFLARERLAAESAPVLCPVDLSPHSRAGLEAAARLARTLHRPLVTLTVVPGNEWRSHTHVDRALPADTASARQRLVDFVAPVDLEGLSVEHRVIAVDDVASAIADAAGEGSLLVMATRSFKEMGGGVGAFTDRVLRLTGRSTLVLRVANADESEADAIRRVARLAARAHAHLEASEPGSALALYELAVGLAPGNAALHEALAVALERSGRPQEALERRELAALIRDRLG